jgi:DNA-binding PadR family transcriptional regulator
MGELDPQAPSPLALTLLALLAEAPMHPYRMQQLIKQRGKDDAISVAERASLFEAIERLISSGLIAVRETTRDQRFPERTVYELSRSGREMLSAWLADGERAGG